MMQENIKTIQPQNTLPSQSKSGLQYLVKPWAHQLNAIEKGSLANELALFFEMGTGKTMTAINILRHWYLQAGFVKTTLILCPPIVIDQWEAEFKAHSKLAHHVVKLKGTGAKRLKLLKANLETPKIFITNYETMLMEDVHLLLNGRVAFLICDESHKLKNIQAKRTKAVIKIADRTEKRLILTGSPILNSPMDIFSQFRVLDKGASFGQNFFVFRGRYFYDRNAGMAPQSYFPDWRPRPGIDVEFNEIIYRKALKAVKQDCLDLPPLVKVKLPVEMTPKQAKLYKELEDDFITYLDDKACVATMALTKILRLQQITSGFIDLLKDGSQIEDNLHTQQEIEHDRLSALEELLEEIPESEKIIIWAPFRFNIEAIKGLLSKLGTGFCTIYGGQSEKERTDGINAFRNSSDCRVCVANPKAGGVGLNLIEASYSIYYGRGYSLEDDLQSEARNYRGGSERHSKVTRIDLYAPGTIDEEIMEALHSKKSIADNILAIKEKLGRR